MTDVVLHLYGVDDRDRYGLGLAFDRHRANHYRIGAQADADIALVDGDAIGASDAIGAEIDRDPRRPLVILSLVNSYDELDEPLVEVLTKPVPVKDTLAALDRAAAALGSGSAAAPASLPGPAGPDSPAGRMIQDRLAGMRRIPALPVDRTPPDPPDLPDLPDLPPPIPGDSDDDPVASAPEPAPPPPSGAVPFLDHVPPSPPDTGEPPAPTSGGWPIAIRRPGATIDPPVDAAPTPARAGDPRPPITREEPAVTGRAPGFIELEEEVPRTAEPSGPRRSAGSLAEAAGILLGLAVEERGGPIPLSGDRATETYEPALHLDGALSTMVSSAHRSGRPTGLAVGSQAVSYDPRTQTFASPAAFGWLDDLARRGLSCAPYLVDDASGLQQAGADRRPAMTVLWRAALLSGAGRLRSGIDPTRPLVLRFWPDLSALDVIEEILPLLSAVSLRSPSPVALVEQGFERHGVNALVGALASVNAIVVASEVHASWQARPETVGRSLFGRLLGREGR